MGVAASLDRAQRRHSVLGVPIGVFYKYSDDQGNYLAAIISFYAFIAIFPLLLLATSIFGFFIQGNEALQEDVLDSALATFPIIGDELGRPDGLTGSTTGVVVGGLAALYGSLGLATALQNAMNVAWSVPRNNRPNPLRLRIKSLLLLTFAGVSVLALTVVTAIGTNTDVMGSQNDTARLWLIRAISVVLTGLLLTGIFRLATARRHHVGWAAPGGFVVAAMWLGLQYLGTVYVRQVLSGTSSMAEFFGVVLGLMGIIYLAAIMGVVGIELNVVLARRLWPRALMTLFTDAADLTDADRRAYAGYAMAQRHKTSEEVEVRFTDPDTGEVRIPQEPERRARKRESKS